MKNYLLKEVKGNWNKKPYNFLKCAVIYLKDKNMYDDLFITYLEDEVINEKQKDLLEKMSVEKVEEISKKSIPHLANRRYEEARAGKWKSELPSDSIDVVVEDAKSKIIEKLKSMSLRDLLTIIGME